MISENARHLERCSRRFAARVAVAAWASHRGWPRLAMASVLAVCIATWLACSIVLRVCGITSMWLRYPLAWGATYGVFLFLLGRLTARLAERVDRDGASIRHESLLRQVRNDAGNPPELSDWLDRLSDDSGRIEIRGGPEAASGYLVILLSFTIVLLCVYFIYVAPSLLAELVVEGALAVWLYRPTSRGLQAHWLAVALERTGLPALCLAAAFLLTGIGLQCYAPKAETIADVWQQAQQPHAARPREGWFLGQH